MQFWTSLFNARRSSFQLVSVCPRGARRFRKIAFTILGSTVVLAITGGGAVSTAQTWEQYPWVSVSGGYENDRLLERGPDVIKVPGGYFMDVIPGILVSRVIGNRTRINLDGHLTLEHFNNDENRSLFGATANGELRRRVGDTWRWRLTAGVNYFADSVQESVDRFHAGAETAFGLSGRTGYIELLAGAQGRSYPNLTTLDDSGIPGTYTELGASLGVTGAIRTAGRLVLSGLVYGQSTDARDPVFDSTSMLTQAAARLAVTGSLWIYLSGMAQERTFGERLEGEDSDSYRQLGAGLEIPIGRNFDLDGRYAFARYTDPLGVSDDIQRFSVGVTWWPGGRGTRMLPDQLPTVLEISEDVIRAGEPHRFRIRAPEAVAVSLVSDFNGWDPDANRMQDAGGGWWETPVALPAGSHQYAYWVDGRLVTPPEAETTVDDGFGGRNGLLYVEPIGP